jgi:hypothetical protein
VKVARKSKLVLIGAGKPQLRKAAPRDWSKAKARDFVSALADTCNVSEACRVSGVPMTVAYRRRKADAAFRAGWLEAIGIAYQRLDSCCSTARSTALKRSSNDVTGRKSECLNIRTSSG